MAFTTSFQSPSKAKWIGVCGSSGAKHFPKSTCPLCKSHENHNVMDSAGYWSLCWFHGLLEIFCSIKLSVKSPSLSHPILFAFTPYPLFEWYPQSKEILLDLSMKCWNATFNAQGSRVIIVVVQVGAVKMYVTAVKELTENERGDETQFTTKIGGKTSLGPSYFVYLKFHSQLSIWCPIIIMPKLAVFAPLIAWLDR